MKVQLPDGKIAEFPDDMGTDEVSAVLQKQFSAAQARPLTASVLDLVPAHVAGMPFLMQPAHDPQPTNSHPPGQSISAITGREESTGLEKIQMGADAVRTVGPIIGDIALTAAAPQLKGTSMGIRALNTIFRAAGAGAGGFLGAKAGDVLAPDNRDTATEQGLIGAGAELGMSGLTGVAGPVLKKAAEVASETTATGKMVKQWLGKKHAQRFLSDFGVDADKETTGLAIGRLFARKKDVSSNLYAQYGDALETVAADSGGRVSLDNVSQYLADLMEKTASRLESEAGKAVKTADVKRAVLAILGTSPDQYDGKVILYLMGKDGLAPKDIRNFLANFWGKKWKNMTQPEISAREGLKDVFRGDLARIQSDVTGETAASLLVQADRVHGEMAEFLKKSPTIKRWIGKSRIAPDLKGFEYAPEKFIDAIFNRATPQEIKGIEQAIRAEKNGDAIWAMLEYQYVRDLFGRYTKKLDSGRSYIQGSGLADEIRANEKWIRQVFGDGTWSRMKDEADFFGTVTFELPGVGNALPRAAGASVGAVAGGFTGAVAAEAVGTVSAWATMSPQARKAIASAVRKSKPSIKAFSHNMAMSNDTD